MRCKNTSFTLVSFIIGILPPLWSMKPQEEKTLKVSIIYP
nr:MAG TPA: hypothetical protein [Caudoviricetes sp.]DAY35684.1 MAG TPA: hypothetical protein [Caudoviricetes sp.]